ncbi:hypothetical protein [Paenibacillus sp. LjRoot56]|uniref:hypothetical protein n=1 Tax=Paenibacillus sp. LjRoot56 TaxID=3342333 RepID=UPI003ECEB3E6
MQTARRQVSTSGQLRWWTRCIYSRLSESGDDVWFYTESFAYGLTRLKTPTERRLEYFQSVGSRWAFLAYLRDIAHFAVFY